MMDVKVRLEEGGRMPEKATNYAAGLDLYARQQETKLMIPKRDRILVDTAVKVELPEGSYAQLQSRSGLAKKKIDVRAGVIDCDYRGTIQVLLSNDSDTDFPIPTDKAIAQMVIHTLPEVILHTISSDLSSTQRGSKGFGSTDACSASFNEYKRF